ncbi:MAG: linear amide C-N hydrolase [Methanomicrobiaceae archaeon]|nr:linear amide C-N hydrolase [Methanomicrobiaceae archaeon]
MKRTGFVLVAALILVVILLVTGSAQIYNISDTGTKTTTEVLLNQENGTYMKVIHVVVRGGTEEEIGYELGKVGIEEFNSILLPFDDPVYGEEKEQCIKDYDEDLYERVQGVKQAYQLSEDNYSYDASFPLYIAGIPLCSAIYFPPVSTEDGHAIAGRNVDWYYNTDHDVFTDITDLSLFTNNTDINDEKFDEILADRMGTLVHVVEIYPDEGHATLVIGTMDLLTGIVDGLNEKGLYISSLQDGDTYTDPFSDLAGFTSTRMNFMQVLGSILEHCANVDEAKQWLAKSRISMPFMGVHFLICDDSGAATIAEYDNKSRELIFIDYKDTAFPLTNYAIHLKPDISQYPPEKPNDAHDDYLRSAKLHDYISDHEGAFTTDDAWKAMKMVEANADLSPEEILAGENETDRLLWTVVTDITDRSMTVKFFLRDGPNNNETYHTHDLVLSEPFTFKLER